MIGNEPGHLFVRDGIRGKNVSAADPNHTEAMIRDGKVYSPTELTLYRSFDLDDELLFPVVQLALIRGCGYHLPEEDILARLNRPCAGLFRTEDGSASRLAAGRTDEKEKKHRGAEEMHAMLFRAAHEN